MRRLLLLFSTLLLGYFCSLGQCPTATTPPSPVSISQLGRKSTYTNVKLNGGTNSITVAPGASVTLTGNYSMVYDGGAGCDGCFTQHHIGLQDGATTVFSLCHQTGGGTTSTTSRSFNQTFNAPTTPGVYYITQVATWNTGCSSVSHTNSPDNAIAVVIVEAPPVVSCRDVTIHLSPSPVTITALGPTTSQLPAQVKGVGVPCPVAATPVASCNCPTGYVAVGYTAETPNIYGIAVSRFTLNCRAVNPDGTFGAGAAVTCYNGTATSTPSTDLAPAGEALVGFQNRLGCAIDNLQGRSKPLAAILAGTSNSTNTTLAGIGGNADGLQPLQLVPDGNVIVGMQTYLDLSTGVSAGYAWNYAKLENVMKGIATASVNCGSIQSATLSQSSFDCSNVGTNNVTVTVTDTYGASSQCNFTVTVVDNEPPTITCPVSGTVSKNTNAGVCTWTPGDNSFNATGTDNCSYTLTYTVSGATTGTGSSLNGVAFNKGTTTVTWEAKDPAGQTANCSYAVTVTDGESPKITCLGNITTASTSLNGAVVNYTAPVGTDNCPGATTTRTAGLPSGATFPIGTTTVTHEVEDATGKKASCSFTVTVSNPYCDNNPNSQKVYVCHQGKAICISVNALQMHLSHGDQFGPCTTSTITARTIPGQEKLVVRPDQFTLGSYPNPFDETTRISYSLPVDSKVSIKVYDVTGREISVILNGDKAAGSYGIAYSSAGLSSGVYYVKMIAMAGGQQFVQTQKLVHTK